MHLLRVIRYLGLGSCLLLGCVLCAKADPLNAQGKVGPFAWSAQSEVDAALFSADCEVLLKAWESMSGTTFPKSIGAIAVVIAPFESSEKLVGSTGGNLLLLDPKLPRLERLEMLSEVLLLRYQQWMGGRVDASRFSWVQHVLVGKVFYPGAARGPWPMVLPERIPRLADIVDGRVEDRLQWSVCLDEFVNESRASKRALIAFYRQACLGGVSVGEVSELFVNYDPKLNAAEMELLWQAFCVDACMFRMEGAFLSSERSLEYLKQAQRIVGRWDGRMSVLDFDQIYLMRDDPLIRNQMEWILERLPYSLEQWHPYYFNAGISLGCVYESILAGDLDEYRLQLKAFYQDCQTAERLSADTKKLIEQYDAL